MVAMRVGKRVEKTAGKTDEWMVVKLAALKVEMKAA